jgi:hypothetical protein
VHWGALGVNDVRWIYNAARAIEALKETVHG